MLRLGQWLRADAIERPLSHARGVKYMDRSDRAILRAQRRNWLQRWALGPYWWTIPLTLTAITLMVMLTAVLIAAWLNL